MEKSMIQDEKGITLIALIITIIVLIILAGVSLNMVIGDDGIITKAQQAKENMEIAQEEEKSDLQELLYQMEDGMGNDYNTYKQVNHPKLATGMTAIKYTDPTESSKGEIVETTSSDVNWYDYSAKKWANAQTKDGSMWVWIPRYAYRLNSSTKTFDIVFLIGTTDEYYDENGEKQTAKRCTSTDEIVDTTTGYTVHPAFTDETAISYQNGGWDKEITGIWVAKFEAGYASGNNSATVKASNVNYSQSDCWVRAVERGEDADGSEDARNWLDGIYGRTTTAIKYPVFQPLTYSMNYINHNDAYNIAKALTDNGNIYGLTSSTDSHLMKNSEWGAVAYLAQSKYGLNGTDITVNNISLNSGGAERTATAGQTGVNSVYGVTGCTSNSTSNGEKQTTIATVNGTTGNTANDGVYTWNQKTGTSSSCTGTIYGIYDLSGGYWERTTGYVANGNGNLKTYGASIAYNGSTLKTMSTKYTTVYPYNSTTDNTGITSNEDNLNIASKNNWIVNTKIYGDAIRETSTAGTGNTSWYNDYSNFPGLGIPFSLRGAPLWDGSGAGLFSFIRVSGYSSYDVGFRAALVVG